MVQLLRSYVADQAAVTVFSTPDDGCGDTRNMESDFAVNKYLHTVAFSWIFINMEGHLYAVISHTLMPVGLIMINISLLEVFA